MSQYDLAEFTHYVFLIFYFLVIIRIIFSWIGLPSQKPLYALFKFSYDATEWYLKIFRRFIPTAGAIDFSPMVALIVLFILENIVVGIIRDM